MLNYVKQVLYNPWFIIFITMSYTLMIDMDKIVCLTQ